MTAAPNSPLIQLQPLDEHNQKLEANVRPRDWKNPTPVGRYNLVVVGAGTAGLVSAVGAAGLGARVNLYPIRPTHLLALRACIPGISL